MRSALWKDIFKEIRGTLNRFIAIFAIVALGVGFFAGLKATTPDMQLTADTYMDDQHFMDVRLLCTMGFTEEDAEALAAQPCIAAVMPTYTADVLLESDAGNVGVRLHALPEDTSKDNPSYLNRPVVLEGRLPEGPGECAFDPGTSTGAVAGTATDFGQIGSTLRLAEDNDSDTLDLLRSREYKVVGIIRSPMYISFQRGSTDIGSGNLSYYMCVSEKEFDSEYYLEMYATVKGAEELDAFSDKYDQLIEEATDSLEEFGDERAQIRYDEIHSDAEAEIQDAEADLAEGEADLAEGEAEYADGQSEYDTQKADAEQKLADARQELDDARRELADGRAQIASSERELADGEAEYERGLAEFEGQIASAESELQSRQEQVDASREEYEAGWAQYEEGQAQLSELKGQIAQIRASGMPEEQLQQVLAPLLAQEQAAETQLSQTYFRLNDAANQISAAQEQLNAGWSQLEAQRAEGQARLDAARAEIESGRRQLANARAEVAQGERDLASGEATYAEKEASVQRELADAQTELDDAKKELDDARQEIADGRQEIRDAWSELDDVEVPEWYILDRDTNIGFVNFASDSEKIENLSDVFPVFFFLVAALVCLTTMTRMVEEQRTQIGVLKALGYGRGAIAAKYLVYAALATISGCVVGLVIGFRVFPSVIWYAYGIMYTMRPVICAWNWPLALTGGGAATACTLLAALWAVYAELMAVPAELIRPKAPPPGKRVLLEKIGFIWKRMKFTSKVTARNIFRYKRRLFMTLIGIAGCTALMLTGFGLRDSISNIVSRQFGDLHLYDALITLSEPYQETDREELDEALAYTESHILVDQETATARNEDGSASMDVRILVPQNPDELGAFIRFRDRVTHEAVKFPVGDRVVITEKLADKLGLGVGDSIAITLDDTKTGHAVIGGVTENYVYNYAYMTPQAFSAMFHEEPEYRLVLVDAGAGPDGEPLNQQQEDEIWTQVIEYDLIDSAESLARTRESFGDVMQSLNAVVWLLVICSNLLAFVVLYNLVNISITERSREIATIKVLGFFNREVDNYVFRENLILTAIGAAIGLIGGIFLHQYVIAEAEVDIVMFERTILPMSYVYSFALTMGFALVVDGLMHFKLKKISMVESLKSTE